ncbi:MAG: porin [Granulosicoccus sp.]
MKFTKTFVAVAIAGIAAAPMIASADTTLSGVVQIQLNGDDSDGDSGDATINADDVLFGIATEHEMNSGLTGYGSLRVDMNRLSNAGSITVDPGTPGNDEDDVEIASLGAADSVYVGFKGGFGDFRFGEIPNAVEYGQVANDIFDVTGEVNGGISYVGTFGPVGLIANFSPEQNSNMTGLGAKFTLGGFTIGLGAEDKAEAQNIAAGVTFAYAGASIGAHYWSQENGDAAIAEVVEVLEENATPENPAVAGVAAAAAGDQTSISVQVGYAFGGVSATVTYSLLEGERDDRGADKDAIRLDAVYDLGGGMDISTRITSENNNLENSDLTSWRLKLSKSF